MQPHPQSSGEVVDDPLTFDFPHDNVPDWAPPRELDQEYPVPPMTRVLWAPIAGAGGTLSTPALHLFVVGGTSGSARAKRQQNYLPTSGNRLHHLLFRRGDGLGQRVIAPVQLATSLFAVTIE